jgi:hypothetical protein
MTSLDPWECQVVADVEVVELLLDCNCGKNNFNFKIQLPRINNLLH